MDNGDISQIKTVAKASSASRKVICNCTFYLMNHCGLDGHVVGSYHLFARLLARTVARGLIGIVHISVSRIYRA